MADEMQKPWTIGRCLEWTTEFFERRGVQQPRVSAEWLLCSAAGLERIDLFTKRDLPLEQHELDAMHQGIKRRALGEPLQYITGETAFRRLSIMCAPGVLIPRPETELLVDYVLEYLDRNVTGWQKPRRKRVALPWNAEVEAARQAEVAARAAAAAAEAGDGAEAADTSGEVSEEAPAPSAQDEGADTPTSAVQDASDAAPDAAPAEANVSTPEVRPARVLEVGCGTGCISLALATERPGCVSCVATDISDAAVDLAERNRAQLGVSPEAVDIRRGDLTAPVRTEERFSFDVLVSNPPYIPSSVMEAIPREVRDYEPELALDGGRDGLDIFRRLVSAAPYMLKENGLLACELFEDALEDAARICTDAGMHDVEILKDLTGRQRFIFAHTG